MKKKFLISFGLFFSFLLSGCFSPVIVDVVEIMDTVEVVEPVGTVDTQKEKISIQQNEPIAQAQYTKYIPAKILDKNFYEKAFSVAEKKFITKNKENKNVNILLVNHHLLAPHFIADTLAQISEEQKQNIKNVILISPNHFHEGSNNIITSNLPFKTPYGFLENINNSNFLENSLNIAVNNTVVKNEHGITGIVGFIQKYFNSTKRNVVKILPIIINDKTSTKEMESLAQNITKKFQKKDTVIIISMDMSHDLFPQIANFHDVMTLQMIKNLDKSSAKRVDTDSKQTFVTMFSIAKMWNQERFILTHHSSSAEILQKQYQVDTTSYITGFFTEGNKSTVKNDAEKTVVTGLFFGDMMFDRYIRQQLDREGWDSILDWRMKRFMTGSDFTVVNFEGAMTENKPYTARDNMLAFTSDPKWAKNMAEYGINIASLANNHSLNFGKQGFIDTKKFLEKYNIATFGTPYNNSEKGNLSVIKNVRGMKIAFVAYHELFDGNVKPIVSEIQNIKNNNLADFIVVYSHWGDEYIQKIHPRPQKKAHAFIDAGADIVIGHHPHVVQPLEKYKDKYIFYSLGNFVFDQVLGKSVRTRLGLGIEFVCENACENRNIKYTLFPLIADKNKTYNFKVELMEEKNQEKFFSWFRSISR